MRSNTTDDISFELVNVLGSYREEQTFDIGKSRYLTLKIANPTNEDSTESTNSTLIIPRKSIPVGWKAEDVADLWCSCISITTGMDVRWITKEVQTKQANTLTFLNRENIIRNLRTDGIFRTHFPRYWVDNEVHEFVNKAFSSAWNRSISVSAMRDYSRLMWHFVEYRLITNRAEDHARLISTTVEELLTLWENHTDNIPKSVISSDEAVLIWGEVESKLLPNLTNLIDLTTKEQKDALTSRIRTFFTDDILRPGFGKRLKKFFELGKNDQSWFKAHVSQARLNSFVNTRNKIAHEGRFPSEESKELFEYYSEMLTILPLMIFSLFGYSGNYVDLAKLYRGKNSKNPSAKD